MFLKSQLLGADEKEKMHTVLCQLNAYVQQNTVNGLSKNLTDEAAYIDEGLRLWSEVSPQLLVYNTKIQQHWANSK